MRRLVPAALLAALAATTITVVGPTGAASGVETLQCDTSVPIFVRKPDTSLTLYQHNEPEVGTPDWQDQYGIGHTWDGITLGGPDGAVYELTPEGQLGRARWLGGSWENGGAGEVLLTGWTGWSRNTLVVDSLGDFYGIAADGNLHWRRFTKTGGTWSYEDRTLATGWAARYNMIWASGDGTIFARTHDDKLVLHVYHAASQRWIESDRQIGDGGWNKFHDVASVGGGVFYALDGAAQQVKWYRYTGNGTWAVDAGRIVGNGGWYGDWQLEGKSNACKIVGGTSPQRPAVPANLGAASSAVQGGDGLVNYFYVNQVGGLTTAKQRYANDFSILEYQTFAGHQVFTGTPGSARQGDNKLQVLANSSDDASFRGRPQSVANGPWAAEAAHDGWLTSDAAVVADSDNVLNVYAVDGSGQLWRRAQVAANGGWLPWRKLAATGLSNDFSVLRNGTAIDVVARFTDNSVRAARLTGDVVGTWRTVGTDATGKPAVVAHQNGNLQVFTRRSNGIVHTQRETSGVFPGTWTAVGSLAGVGSPAAVIRGTGLVELAVRGTDNYVYQASQLAPAAGFSAWQIKYWEETATDPTGLTLADGSPIFTWRSPQGLVLTSYIAPGPSSASAEQGTTFRGATGRK
ncbi:tachylectin-related carbohydrate-binding protein [Actinosynnema sp. NPDC047251]|uniref:Putative secreted protein n=1 Tax=Saccharothrix espanaensis (strain ATCC 51144 / DSM 44229 / JCM 9112 / NBRC 15066 / NRRL 15764) TaxID=1179773 RepID=K0JW40_SACES|nr:tachylectin-related carbohydrate-binding protein [Saccharothrix espanaensis]CCH30241.1 putative secreted protein [Saccharothrix espanaensis DSM 44229]